MSFGESILDQQSVNHNPWTDFDAAKNNNVSAKTPTAPSEIDYEAQSRKHKAMSAYYQDTLQKYTPQITPEMGSHAKKLIDSEAVSKKSSSDVLKGWKSWTSEAQSTNTKAEKTKTVETKIKETALSKKGSAQGTPKLPQPESSGDLDKLMSDMNTLLLRISELEAESLEQFKVRLDRADVKQYIEMIECIKHQKANQDDSTISIHQKITKTQEIKKAEYKKLCDVQDKLIENEKTNKALGWVSSALTFGLLGLFLASIVLTIVTGGAAMPLAFAAAEGVLAVAQGATTIVSGVNSHSSSKLQGEHFVLQSLMDDLTTLIKNAMQQYKDFCNAAWKTVSELKHIEKNRHQNLSFGK